MKTLLFVDDEPRVLQGLQRQLHGMRHEWEMHFLESGPKSLEFMATTPVDVIVSDMMMPGMDGAELLTHVMKRHPNTVRLILSGHADREAVLRLVGPAHQYLSKPCNPEELRAAISRALAMRDLLNSDQLKQLVSRIRCLPSLPTLHAELTAELQAEEPSVERASQIIAKDLGMATKVLQLVNSSFFGLPQPTTKVSDAVLYLGLATVRALVLSVEVFSQFDERTIKLFSIDQLAHHCWMTSVFARRIAQSEHCASKIDDQCFLAGFLHDLGHLILAAGLPDRYSLVLQQAATSGISTSEAERAEFGATHAEVGAYLLGLWGLPTPVIEAVALHHQPVVCLAKEFSPVIAVHVADALANLANRSHLEPPGTCIDTAHLAALGLDGRIEDWRTLCLAAPK